jgi:glycosyltransferase involved in cell wall biosynthesis
MGNSKISIIVPVFNVVNYLSECLESILSQTYSNIEVVLVDDGSTDDSPWICDEFARRDERVKVIHQQNSGVSNARNNGIKAATGNFLAFVDSDDYIESDTYEKLMALQEKYDSDISISNRILHASVEVPKHITVHNGKKAMKDLLAMKMDTENYLPCSMCGGIYRRELFDDVLFPSDIHHFEDYLMQVLLVNKANTIVVTTEAFYHYRIREGSANHVNYNQKTASCLLIADRLRDMHVITDRQQYTDVASYFIAKCYFTSITSTNADKDLQQHLRRKIYVNKGNIIKSNSIKPTHKVALLSYCLFPQINARFFSSKVKN